MKSKQFELICGGSEIDFPIKFNIFYVRDFLLLVLFSRFQMVVEITDLREEKGYQKYKRIKLEKL